MYAKILNQLKKGNSSIMDYEKLLYDFECRGLKFAETENEYIIVY